MFFLCIMTLNAGWKDPLGIFALGPKGLLNLL